VLPKTRGVSQVSLWNRHVLSECVFHCMITLDSLRQRRGWRVFGWVGFGGCECRIIGDIYSTDTITALYIGIG
jgi:hypothetical protein